MSEFEELTTRVMALPAECRAELAELLIQSLEEPDDTEIKSAAAFIERGLSLLKPWGMLGAITSRIGFFLSSFQKWREEILLEEARPTVFAALGYGVLDTAMVETAAYCLEVVQ